MEQRVTELEIKVAFQEDLIDKLNQVVIDLRAEVDAVTRKLRRIEQEVAADASQRAPDEKPPHY